MKRFEEVFLEFVMVHFVLVAGRLVPLEHTKHGQLPVITATAIYHDSKDL